MRKIRSGLAITALATAAVTALAACGGTSNSSGGAVGLAGAFGKVPAASGTPHAGTVTVAEPPNAVPTWILPITPGANSSVYSSFFFQYQMWRPLYFEVNGTAPKETPSMSLAADPVWSNNDKTATVTLKGNYTWSDGQPVTSQDILFFIDEVKAAVKENPSNWSFFNPGLGIPDQIVSMTTPNPKTIVFNLNKSVNPTWFTEDQLGEIQPLPSHAWARDSAGGPTLDFTNPANAKKIYDYLAAASKSVNTYATNPLWQTVDGPYKLTSFNNTTGAFTMAPNTSYGGPHSAKVPTFSAVPFTSDTAEYNAVKSGSIDVGYVQTSNLPQISSIESSGYNAFGFPDFGWFYVTYNFKDTTGDFGNIIKQLYVRQAMAHLQDEAGYLKAFFAGAGAQAYGPIPKQPTSPFAPANALTAPYTFSVSAAVSLLKSHGWKVVPGGTDTCVKPGTGTGECGAGIPAGTPLAWNLIYTTSPANIGQEVTDLAAQAKKAGIEITLQTSNFNFMIANYNDPAAPKNDGKWAMQDFGGFSESTYPTTFGVFNSGGQFNIGGYTDANADKLIIASITSNSPSAVTAEASYLTQQQPSLFQPNPDFAFESGSVMVWKKTLSGPPTSFEMLTQTQLDAAEWYFTK
jgi:peptide/nickel transport system substrate-binding protein